MKMTRSNGLKRIQISKKNKMKTKLLVIILAVCGIANAQTWQWAESADGTSSDVGNAIATDSNGNVYVTGYFESSSIIFGGSTVIRSGLRNIFVVKYNSTGNVLWAKTAVGTSTGIDMGYGICTDKNGNVYVTGSFRSSSITFGSYVLNNAGGSCSSGCADIFIVKYDANGNELWAKSAGGTDPDEGKAVTTDPNGNVFITGYFRSMYVSFGSTTLNNNFTGAGLFEVFTVKYDSTGNVLWAKSKGGTSNDDGKAIVTDLNGNVYITGNYSSTDFGGLSNAGGSDVFIVKYAANGNEIWERGVGGSANEDGFGITTDANGNIYITGEFSSSTSAFGSTSLTSSGGPDIFIAQYDLSGNVLWAKSAGGAKGDVGFAISADAVNNIYVTGSFRSPSLTIGSTTLINASSSNDIPDIFVAKYDAGGSVLWVKSAGGTDFDRGYGICTAKGGAVNITGYFISPSLAFGSNSLTNVGSEDVFVAQINDCNLLPPTITPGGSTTFCQGDSVTLTTSGASSYLWSNNATTQSINVYSAGVYSVTVTDGNGCSATSTPKTVTVNPVDISLTVNNSTLTANATPASYQWVICPAMQIITGETNQTFSPSQNGNYAVIVTQNSCMDTSNCYPVTIAGLSFVGNSTNTVVYPNPVTNQFIVKTAEFKNATASIYNLQGQLLQSIPINSSQTIVKTDNLETGIYFLQLKSSAGATIKKIIKE